MPDVSGGAGREMPAPAGPAGYSEAVGAPRRPVDGERGPCPKCKAIPGESCRTPSGREASRIHEARLRPSRYELLARDDVWAELERRGATIACVDLESAATGLGETAITAMETFESEMAVIAISDG